MKQQMIRFAILLVIAGILLAVNLRVPRPADLWVPVIHMTIGTAVCVAAAKFTGLWK